MLHIKTISATFCIIVNFHCQYFTVTNQPTPVIYAYEVA